jgi:SPASM domain peptide maturase of grasp-with-spasm system
MKTYKDTDYFILLEPRCFVAGYSRAAMYDLQRRTFQILDKEIYEFCKKYNKKKVNDILNDYANKNEVIRLINFLIKKEFVFIGSAMDAKNIVPINTTWEDPARITNCAIEYSTANIQNLPSIKYIINKYLIHAIEFVSFSNNISITDVEKIMQTLSNSINLHSVSFTVKYNEDLTKEKITPILNKFCINHFYIHSAPVQEFIKDKSLLYTKQFINSPNSCGVICKEYFSLNKIMFLEAMSFNSCLNRKLCIDKNGNIKNCLAMSKSYGNINDIQNSDKWLSTEFKQLWNINKDKIDVCKDCEYRYMCTDCRHHIKDKNNIYSQPSKCNYNPYIAKWSDEDGYVPAEECGSYSQETGFVPNKKKIAELNKLLWAE